MIIYTIIIGISGKHFFIREDTIAKKIFIKDSVNVSEVILYDFSLNVGDTLYAKHGWCAGKKLTVKTIDTVTTLVGSRRQLHLSDTSGYFGYQTIESIGSIEDPFLNFIPFGDPVYYLVCSYQNHIKTYDSNSYGNTSGYTCYYYDSIPCNATFTYSVDVSGQIILSLVNPVYSSQWYCYPCTITNYAPTTISFPCNGTYSVGCQVSMNSSGTDVCYYTIQNITINNIPGSLHANCTYSVGCNGQVNFTNTSTGIVTNVPNSSIYNNWTISYEASGYQVTTSDSTSPSFTLTPNQGYIGNLTLYNYFGNNQCSSTFIDTIFVSDCTTDIYHMPDKHQIKIYPNPASNKINVNTTDINEIKLCDLLGKEVINTKDKEIDVSNLPDGVYFVQVQTKQNTATQKIIVQH